MDSAPGRERRVGDEDKVRGVSMAAYLHPRLCDTGRRERRLYARLRPPGDASLQSNPSRDAIRCSRHDPAVTMARGW